MADPFRYLLRVRYGECDAQHVVFNARYGDYVDLAFNEFMRVLWGDYEQMLGNDVDIKVVHFSIDWTAPARFDEVLQIEVCCVNIGNTSFTIETDMARYPDGTAVARAKIVYVFFQPGSGAKITVPGHMRSGLEVGAPDIVINHAGVLP